MGILRREDIPPFGYHVGAGRWKLPAESQIRVLGFLSVTGNYTLHEWNAHCEFSFTGQGSMEGGLGFTPGDILSLSSKNQIALK